MTALIKHKDGDILRQGKNEFVEISDDLSSWKINFHKKVILVQKMLKILLRKKYKYTFFKL